MLLGNANARLNSWRQRRLADFLTPIGKHTLKEEIPTDKHLFPDQLHERIKSEHNHSTTNNNLIGKPPDRPHFSGRPTFLKPFRASSTYAAQPGWRKRKWSYNPKVDNANPTGPTKRRVSPRMIPTRRADYAVPQLVPLQSLPLSTTDCRLAQRIQNWKHISLRIPGSWSQSKDTRYPKFANHTNGDLV